MHNYFKLNNRLINLIHSKPVMIIATTDKFSYFPWITPVYFIYYNNLFYFMSSINSTHIQHITNFNKISISIFANNYTISNLQGIQMFGNIKNLETKDNKLKKKIIKKYCNKFNILKRMSKLINIKIIKNMFSYINNSNINLYKFKPNKIIYNDNKFGLGFKKNINIKKTFTIK